VTEKLGGPFKIQTLHIVSELPRTQTGKIPRPVIQNAYTGEKYDESTLESADVLENFPRRE
jgi:acyl-coenzyme A synthetase/AMP-(fatty) acid ligase